MEKQPKPVRPGGKKRQRKISLPGNASEPKHLKLDVSSNLSRLKDTAPPEKKQAQVKPKKSNIKKLSEGVTMLQPVLPPKLTSKAKPMSTNALIGSKKDKIKTAHALIESQSANGSVTSIFESAKAYSAGNQIEPINQADMSKKLKTPKANIIQGQKLKSKSILAPLPKKKKKKPKGKVSEEPNLKVETVEASNTDIEEPLEIQTENTEDVSLDEAQEKFPILKDKKTIEKFMKVALSNNQKGRIRQAIKLSLQGTANNMFPEIINGKIQAILNSSVDLTDSELRRIRILYNMLKTAIEAPSELLAVTSPKKKKANKKKDKEGEDDGDKKMKQEEVVQKVKGPKRYVVFLGNLPLDINKEKIMDHFRELNEQIKDIRLPKVADGTKSAIAYVELSNEPSYELALSKHHSMMGNKRIKVLYTAQKNGKISRSEAKGKSAKLIALQKSGKLVGSTPQTKKRSHRRNIMKKAKAKEAAANA